jgi:hypothetical protein
MPFGYLQLLKSFRINNGVNEIPHADEQNNSGQIDHDKPPTSCRIELLDRPAEQKAAGRKSGKIRVTLLASFLGNLIFFRAATRRQG